MLLKLICTVILAWSMAVCSVQAEERIESTVLQDSAISRVLPRFSLIKDVYKQAAVLRKDDGSAYVVVQILKPEPYFDNLQKYAENVMQYYQGSNLTPQPQRRGYSFRYQDEIPCAGLVSYFDGTSYVMMGACGLLSQDELTKALSVAKKQLGLDEILSRTALPNLYY